MNSNVTFLSVIKAELLKLRSVRSSIIGLGVTAFLTIGFSALLSYLSTGRFSDHNGPPPSLDGVSYALVGTNFAQFAVGVIGALFITSEFANRSIHPTLAAVPNRAYVVMAKAAVLKLAMIATAGISVLASFFISQAIIGHKMDMHATLSDGTTLRAVLFAILYLVLLTLIGFSIGLIVRHTAATISIFVSLLLVLPLITIFLPSSWRNPVMRYLPSVLGNAMTGGKAATYSYPMFGAWAAAGVLVAYAVVLFGVGLYLFERRDV